MSANASWMEAGYGDVESATRRDDALEVVFANGDVVRLDQAALGVTGDFTVDAAEGGAAVLLTTSEGQREVDWTLVRSAADPAFAQELRERDADEARRIGRRLRALRQNRGMSQKAVANVVGMSSPQLAKLEQGETDMRVSTLRSVLRALDASFADIAGPDAPELSVDDLARRAQRVGVPRDVIKRLGRAVDPRQLLDLVERGFGWDRGSILADTLAPPIATADVALKHRGSKRDGAPGLIALAESLARRSALAYSGRPGTVPRDPRKLRSLVVGDGSEITLELLIRWCWEAGVVVVPMDAKGGFEASAWVIGDQPVVVIKEAPDYKAYWLFALAHELGHLGLGHVRDGGIVDLDYSWKAPDDQEKEANAYALEFLVPEYREMLEEIRRRSKPDPDGTFKFKAREAATARGYNQPLVLLVAAFGLTNVARTGSRWGSANNDAKLEGSAREVVASAFARNLDLERLDRLDAVLVRTVALGT
jgi:transcriptional regulator with XRE-family HTH domain